MRAWLARQTPEALYARYGAAYITRFYSLGYVAAVVFGAPIVFLLLVTATEASQWRYGVAFVAGTGSALLGLSLSNRRATRLLEPALIWDPAADSDATIAAWRATVSAVPSQTVATFIVCQLVSTAPWSVLVTLLFDLTVLQGILCAVCVAVLSLYPTVVLTAAYELFLRPLRHDLARRLPPDYGIERPSPSLRLWLIALVPTVLVVNTLVAFFASELDDAAARVALSLLVALALTLLATFLVARLILGPVAELTNVLSRIRAGDLMARAVPEREDELGALVLEFNRMSDDLVAAREHLLSAREEERRRLRRDLHDGLGAAIAAISLQLQAAQHAMDRDPLRVEPLLAGANEAMHDVLEDVRRLVYDLRPPALDTFGLLGALRNHATSLDGPDAPQFEVSAGDLGDLSAAVEIAALRIAQEAMTNVVRHAHARSCVVELACNGVLRVCVRDDGIGFTGQGSGVGLLSMRERAGELGGSVRVSAVPGGGTEVLALLPAEP